MATTHLLTVDDLAHYEDDGFRRELIRGELHCMPPTNIEHGRVSGSLFARLYAWSIDHKAGLVIVGDSGFVLRRDPDTLLAPDIAFISAERIPSEPHQRQFGELAPDLVVEVLSPSERAGTVALKVAAYLESGVRTVWLVDPRRRAVTIHTPDHPASTIGPNDTLDGGDVLPGFRVPVLDIFR